MPEPLRSTTFASFPRPASLLTHSHLTQCINEMVSEGQLPYKIVNLLWSKLIVNNNLTICGGVDFQNPLDKHIVGGELEARDDTILYVGLLNVCQSRGAFGHEVTNT